MPNDLRQGTQGGVHGFSVGKHPGHVRGEKSYMGAMRKTAGMFVPDADGKIIFRRKVGAARFMGCFLHKTSVRADGPAGR